MLYRVDLAIQILSCAILTNQYDVQGLLHALRYIKASKKQLVRRGAFSEFRGHAKSTPTPPVIQEQDTKEEEEIPSPTSMVTKLRTKVQESRIPKPPPLPSREDLHPVSTYKIKVAKSTKSNQKNQPAMKEEVDKVWACTIM